ncbi:MAG: hypothetical protein ACMV0I_06175 [Pseudomonas sp.]
MSNGFISKDKFPVLEDVVVDIAAIPVLSDVIEDAVDTVFPVLEQAVTAPPPATPEPPSVPSAESLARIEVELQAMTRKIVDDIVAAHLPRLEQELRDRLDAQLSRLLRVARR